MNIERGKIFPLVLLGALAAAALLACDAPDPSRGPRLRLLIAAEAQPYYAGSHSMIHDYNYRMGVAIDVTTAPSTMILARLEQTPPPDLVLVSDPRLVQAMRRRDLLDTPRWVLERVRDKLALVARQECALTFTRLEDLRRPEVRSIGLTNAKTSRIGEAAREALSRAQAALRPIRSPKAEVRHEPTADLDADPRIKTFATQDALVEAIESGTVQVGLIRESQWGRFARHGLKLLLAVDPEKGQAPPYVAFAVVRRSSQLRQAHQFWGFFENWFHTPLLLPSTPGGGSLIRMVRDES